MNIRALLRAFLAFAIAAALVLLVAQAALAHEQRDVGQYHLEVGFFSEPAVEGQINGIDLHVTDTSTNQPVTGLESTLQVEITCLTTKTSKVFPIEPVDPDGDPGHYNNALIPTQPGQYSFRFFGTINGTPINETFTSGPNTFSDVEPATDAQFPQQLPSMRELAAAAQGDQATIQKAEEEAASANTFAYIGMGLGVVGIALGATALGLVLRKH